MSLPRDLAIALPATERQRLARCTMAHWRAMAPDPATWCKIADAPEALHRMCPALGRTVPARRPLPGEAALGPCTLSADARYMYVQTDETPWGLHRMRNSYTRGFLVFDLHNKGRLLHTLHNANAAYQLPDGRALLDYGNATWSITPSQGLLVEVDPHVAVLADGSRIHVHRRMYEVRIQSVGGLWNVLETPGQAYRAVAAGSALLVGSRVLDGFWVGHQETGFAWQTYTGNGYLNPAGTMVAVLSNAKYPLIEAEVRDTLTGALLWAAQSHGQLGPAALSDNGTLAMYLYGKNVLLIRRAEEHRVVKTHCLTPPLWVGTRLWWAAHVPVALCSLEE